MSLLSARDLRVEFSLPAALPWGKPTLLRAVDGVSLEVSPGETLGIVGESGSGKSTLVRSLVGMQALSAGEVVFDGSPVTHFDASHWRKLRRDVQMVFQDPLASLNPRMTIAENIAEPLVNLFPEYSGAERWQQVRSIMPRVGLDTAWVNRYPHEFSGGQCQRVGIARALVVRPRVLICDEAVSALDVTIQAQIVELLKEIQAEMNLAMLFIAHDLAVVKGICHRVLVMRRGQQLETAATAQLFAQPQHPYTQALLAAVPVPDPALERQRRDARRSGKSVTG